MRDGEKGMAWRECGVSPGNGPLCDSGRCMVLCGGSGEAGTVAQRGLRLRLLSICAFSFLGVSFSISEGFVFQRAGPVAAGWQYTLDFEIGTSGTANVLDE